MASVETASKDLNSFQSQMNKLHDVLMGKKVTSTESRVHQSQHLELHLAVNCGTGGQNVLPVAYPIRKLGPSHFLSSIFKNFSRSTELQQCKFKKAWTENI